MLIVRIKAFERISHSSIYSPVAAWYFKTMYVVAEGAMVLVRH
jgi:hypothetical protein